MEELLDAIDANKLRAIIENNKDNTVSKEDALYWLKINFADIAKEMVNEIYK